MTANECQGRNDSSRLKNGYSLFHDFARHVIHSTETLGVALDTVNSMIEQQKLVTESQEMSHTRQRLHFQRQMLGNLRARSESNQLRLQNEINFVGQVYYISRNKADFKRHSTLLLKNKARPFFRSIRKPKQTEQL